MSIKQLRKCINHLERECVYTDNGADDTIVDLEVIEADPGNGKIVSTLVMQASPSETQLERTGTLNAKFKIEMFEKHEKIEPIVYTNFAKKLTR